MTLKVFLNKITCDQIEGQKQWLRNQIAELEPSGQEKEAESILLLLENLEKVANEEYDITFMPTELEETKEVNDLCPHCECEVDMKWNVKKQGLHAKCPHCGNMFMLCNYCPATDHESPETCDYDPATDSCRYKREVA